MNHFIHPPQLTLLGFKMDATPYIKEVYLCEGYLHDWMVVFSQTVVVCNIKTEMIGNKIKGLGEIVLRVNDMESMKHFYRETIGFELMYESDNYTFFKIAEGVGGHTQTLALFAKSNPTAFGEALKAIEQQHTTLHHFALEIEKSDYEEMLILCKKSKIEYVTEKFEWVKWKSIFIKDPESNIVEFVCHDPKV